MLQLVLLVFFYLVLPFALSFLVLRFIGKHSQRKVVPEIQALIELEPVPPKHFRPLILVRGTAENLGDFDYLADARDVMYQAKGAAEGKPSEFPRRFVVIDAFGDILEEI